MKGQRLKVKEKPRRNIKGYFLKKPEQQHELLRIMLKNDYIKTYEQGTQ